MDNRNISEIWKDVKGFEGYYQVSNKGRLASTKSGEFYILSMVNSKGGYFSIVLEHGDKVRYTRLHRIVYEAFVGNIPSGKQYHIHHINGDRQDNRADNLVLVSCAEHHNEHMKINPSMIKGMVNYNKYIRPKKIVQCDLTGNILAIYPNSKDASQATGICQRNILQVANKTPFNKKGNIRKQAGGYVWKFAD